MDASEEHEDLKGILGTVTESGISQGLPQLLTGRQAPKPSWPCLRKRMGGWR